HVGQPGALHGLIHPDRVVTVGRQSRYGGAACGRRFAIADDDQREPAGGGLEQRADPFGERAVADRRDDDGHSIRLHGHRVAAGATPAPVRCDRWRSAAVSEWPKLAAYAAPSRAAGTTTLRTPCPNATTAPVRRKVATAASKAIGPYIRF